MLKKESVLSGQRETVLQAKDFLQRVTKEDYQRVIKPHFASSAGTHMRHILDHYLALKVGLNQGLVNYNTRNRLSEVETCPLAALTQWHEVEQWLTQVSQLKADSPITVKCETSIHHTHNAHTQSTLARELVFVSSHAIHHFSLLAVMSSLLGKKHEINFGVAPSTTTHTQQQA